MYSRRNHLSILTPLESSENSYSLIEENLYISNRDFANNYQMLKSIGISLIIAVYPKDIKYCYLRPPDCRFHHIEVKDSIHEDLISHFDHCFHLINEELTQTDGKVLVFCGAGLSRSVTIISAFLMKKYRIGAEEALERVKHKREKINPNIGFLAQLSLYEDMNYELDLNYNEYRLFILINLKKKMWTEQYWNDSSVGQLKRILCEPMQSYFDKLRDKTNNNSSHRSQTNESKAERSQNSQIYYKCKVCDHVLFKEINVLMNFDCDKSAANQCMKIFIEPIKWMIPLICKNKSAKLECPKCSIILGSFKWKSYVCQCIFHNQLQDSRIFKIQKSSVVQYSE